MNPSYIVGFVICLTDIMSTAMRTILQLLILMMDIPLDMIQINSPEESSFDQAKEKQSGYYSESAPATDSYSIRIIRISRLLFLQYPNPEKQGDKLL